MTEKRQRSAAKGRFTRVLRALNDEFDVKENLDVAELELAFRDVEHAWRNVEEKHDVYIATLTEGDTEEDDWINPIQQLYKDARKRFTSIKSDSTKMEAVNTRLRAREAEYNNFIQICDNVKTLITKNPSKELLSRERENINQSYNKVKDAHSEYSKVAPIDGGKAELSWISRISEISLETNCAIDKHLKKVNDINTKPNFRLQKIPLPKFEGDVRNYPRFKRDFVKLVQPTLSDNEAAFGLRQCLSSDVEKCLGACDDNIENMLKRLDKRFGDPCKITDAVVSEIRDFKNINADQKHLILQFINIVEKGYIDLKCIDMEKEISNANVVSLIENKLPMYIAERWYLKMHEDESKIDRKNKFPSLLLFLKTERDALEYGISELRHDTPKQSISLNLSDGAVNTITCDTKCLIHNRSDHTTAECNVYNNKSLNDKFYILRRNRACYGCLLPGHTINNCTDKKKCSEDCNQFHHSSLHNPEINAYNTYIDPIQKSNNTGLLLIQRIKIGKRSDKYANIFWDSGSSISLITERKANELSLSGNPVCLNVTTVRGIKQTIHSHEYHIELIDKQGRFYKMAVYGIDNITNEISKIKVDNVTHLFININKNDIERPSGSVDILIGMEYAAWHPVIEQSYEHLVVYKNAFGRCLGGYHTTLTENTCKNVNIADVVNLISSPISIQNFFEVESMGTECTTPRCGSCRCGKCPIGGKEFTIKEERELALIEKNVQFYGDHWVATYPWLRSPSELPDNYYQILKCLEKIEKQLRNDTEHAKKYCDQIDDMLNRGVARKLTEQELKTYDGPFYYIAHHAVQKVSSKSTPLRIVFNSSKMFKGHCLNDYWAKGPDNYINNLLGCLIRFREHNIGFIGDIKKMYNSVLTSTVDQHCHRFLWRGMKESVKPETYIITAVNFGDRPSGTIAAVALRKTALMEKEQFPEASKVVLESTYVDDIIDSVKDMQTAERITDNITTMLKKGNFHMKEWVYSYKTPDKTEEEEINMALIENDHVEKVLGMKWLVKNDSFNFEISDTLIEFCKKPLETITLNKRIIMSLINGLYDPMGLAAPFTVYGKILMRKLYTNFPNLGWDDPISDQFKAEWINYFNEMIKLSSVYFKRCVKPEGSAGEPDLILFSDASNDAYGACCFLRWTRTDGTVSSRLFLAKSRVAPLKVQSIVRLELCAAVLSKRLRCFVEKHCRITFNKIIHIVDSQIVRCMIQKESYGFNTFVATRVGEIQEGTDPVQWYWINGKENIADIITRGVSVEDITMNSEWQNGPLFLSRAIEDWPISNTTTNQDLPERNKVIMTIAANSDEQIIDINRFSKYIMLIRVTARIMNLTKIRTTHSLKRLSESPNARELDNAELFWIKETQKPMQQEFQHAMASKGSLRKMSPKLNENEIFVVGGRADKWVEISYNKQEIPIISSKHRFTKLVSEHIHKEGHLGVESDIAKIRARYWVIGLRKLCRTIRYNCFECRKKDRNVSSQIMGKLPIERLKPAPAWSHIGIDLFGPFSVRGDINKRSTGNVYGVIFTCLLIRAVYIDIAVDYSTDGFLMVFRRFISLRGCPITIYSDSGPQLVGASNELKKIVENWDWQKIKDFGSDKGIDWNFSPGDAPWWNGCVESLIKSVKKGIHHAIGLQRLSFSEMLTVMLEVSNLINERPVGIKPDSASDFSYLCPNDMILGRCSSRIPGGPWNETANIKKRFYFIQSIIDCYWKKWTQCYFPSLMIQQKWHHQHRNMKIGDVVIIQDKNVVRGQWRLGRISAVHPDNEGIVRNVSVEYKYDSDSKIFTTINRPVQRLILIVPIDEDIDQ